MFTRSARLIRQEYVFFNKHAMLRVYAAEAKYNYSKSIKITIIIILGCTVSERVCLESLA